jgi:dihydrofolate reductase
VERFFDGWRWTEISFYAGRPERGMSRIRYQVAMSLDGYIAGPKGEYDWIEVDADVDFGAIWAEFDTLLMGRKTWDVATERLGKKALMGKRAVIVSRTLSLDDDPEIKVISEMTRERMAEVRAASTKDVWLMGGAALFRSLLELGEVDTVEVSVLPVLLGGGITLLEPPARRTRLRLVSQRVYKSGRIALVYEVLK